MSATLEIKNLSKTFNKGTINEKIALDHINLTLNEGDFVTVIGGNGAGKSTMLNAVAGVWPVDEGAIIVDGNNITGLPDFKRATLIGRVFQDPMLGSAPDMQIIENLALAARRGKRRTLKWGVTKKEKEDYKEQLKILDLGLEDRLTQKVGLLSGGQRQALALIMATMIRPDLLLLDEHTAALDPKSSDTVMMLTDKIVHEKNITTIMVTHNLRHAVEHGTRTVMMHNGEAIMDVSGAEKDNKTINDYLTVFNEISIECGN